MDKSKRILIAIDDSEASTRAVRYVATITGGQRGFHLYLLHILAPVPSDIQDIAWVDDPRLLQKAKADARAAQARWIEKAEETAQPLFTQALSILNAAGFSDQDLETHCEPSFEVQELVPQILKEARTHECGTVVVGRETFPNFQELFHYHVGDHLVAKSQGLALWVVE